MTTQPDGFTLIELVCCVFLVGIISATIAPRYTDLRTNALEAIFKTVRSDFNYAISFVYAMGQFEQAESGGVPATIPISSATITMNLVSGYPRRNQPVANCSGLAMLEPAIDDPMNNTTNLVFVITTTLLGVSTASAGGGGGNPGTLLELLLLGEDFDDWTQSFSPDTVTFTSPNGRSFSYNHTTGKVICAQICARQRTSGLTHDIAALNRLSRLYH